MSKFIISLTEKNVHGLLEWKPVVAVVEQALRAVSEKKIDQPPKMLTRIIGTKNRLITMSVYIRTAKNTNAGVLSCTTVTIFPDNPKRNPPLPSLIATLFMYDEDSGKLKCILEANTLTAWRTAAASIVASKYLYFSKATGEPNVLAILGAGVQAREHAIGFHYTYKFKEIRIWNIELQAGKKLVEELQGMGIPAKLFESVKDCVANAEVIVTATFSRNPIIEYDWVKSDVHINALGKNELSEFIYKQAVIFVDSMREAEIQLKYLFDMNVSLMGEIGDLILGSKKLDPSKITIFQSLGIAAEDALVGKLVFDRFVKETRSEK